MPPGDSNPAHLFPLMETKVLDIVAELSRWCDAHWPGHKAAISEGFRTRARQVALYAQGRTAPGDIVTYKNGTNNPSNHQSCLACDIVGLTASGNLTWECPQAFWDYLGHLARAAGLAYGGDWKMHDWPHVEWNTSDAATYAKARAWKKAQGLV